MAFALIDVGRELHHLIDPVHRLVRDRHHGEVVRSEDSSITVLVAHHDVRVEFVDVANAVAMLVAWPSWSFCHASNTLRGGVVEPVQVPVVRLRHVEPFLRHSRHFETVLEALVVLVEVEQVLRTTVSLGQIVLLVVLLEIVEVQLLVRRR